MVLSLNGSILADSEPRAQFARIDDWRDVTVIALGALALETGIRHNSFFRRPRCHGHMTRCDQFVPLAARAVFIGVTIYDLGWLRKQKWVAVVFAVATVDACSPFRCLPGSMRAICSHCCTVRSEFDRHVSSDPTVEQPANRVLVYARSALYFRSFARACPFCFSRAPVTGGCGKVCVASPSSIGAAHACRIAMTRRAVGIASTIAKLRSCGTLRIPFSSSGRSSRRS